DLFCSVQVDDKFKLSCLLYRQFSRFGTFQYLVHVNSSAPVEVIVVRPVEHEAALIDKLLLEVNSRQPMFDGKLDNPLSFGEKAATGGGPNRAHLLLLCGLKGALQTFGVGLRLDPFQFQLQCYSRSTEIFRLEVSQCSTPQIQKPNS